LECKFALHNASNAREAFKNKCKDKDKNFDLKQFSIIDLMLAGYTAEQRENKKFDDLRYDARGFNIKQLKDAGFSAIDFKKANDEIKKTYGKNDIHIKFTARGLKDAGFTAKELKEAGFSAKELVDKKLNYSQDEIILDGFTAKELKEVGFNAKELKEAGFMATQLRFEFNDKELKEAGFDVMDFKDVVLSRNPYLGRTDHKEQLREELKKIGFTYEEIKKWV
jgi:intracellular multiplication protein IcmE